MSNPTTLLGLSGPSSSGKTTLARLLRSIFPPETLLILHEDDFYRPEEQLPIRNGLKDWDCAAAIDIPALVAALRYMKQHGKVPADLESKEDKNEVGESGVEDAVVERLKAEVGQCAEKTGWGKAKGERLIIVDGFLLFGKSVREIREALDIRILVRARYEDAKSRREARSGYVTLEGFWKDPEGYVDLVVWPAYVEEHDFMFVGKDVDGEVDKKVMEELGVDVCPGDGNWKVQQMLEWLVPKVLQGLTPDR